MCVCVYMHTFEYVHTYIQASVDTHMHKCITTHMFLVMKSASWFMAANCVYVCMYVCMYVYLYSSHVQGRAPVLVLSIQVRPKPTYTCMHVLCDERMYGCILV